MQRVLLMLISVLALYACTGTVPHKQAEEKPAVKAVEAEPIPAPQPLEPAIPVVPDMSPVSPADGTIPHIALLLPMKSPIFGAAAEAVKQGFWAGASYGQLGLPIRVYSDFDENVSVVNVYREAIENGASAVVGPLTRNGVGALAMESNIPVPTLALNIVEGEHAPKLYFFGMAIEEEARQVARLAARQGLHQAIIVTVGTPLSQRMQSAFEEEWNASGRGILREVEFKNDIDLFADIGDTSDTMVFIAAGTAQARLIRPYLPIKVPVYSSSQVFSGNTNTLTNYDLNGIRFVDMPWLLQPDHPAVMIYQRPNPPLPIDRERLYALGIDSYRLVQLLLLGKVPAGLPLDGVSGRIWLHGRTFHREALPARFVEGQALPSDVTVSPSVQMFPDQRIK